MMKPERWQRVEQLYHSALEREANQRACEDKDAFVTKHNAAGTRFLYSTYIGGTGEDSAEFNGKVLDLDSEGNTWVVGLTQSCNFPIRAGIQNLSSYFD